MLSTPMIEVPRLNEEAHIPTPVTKFVDNAQKIQYIRLV